MTGKSYSIREMKTIVEYLTENKLYSEIRGRKMWMDFANSQRTTRTWQSLKETFLKRILPDIHNPYYKLNMEQINSFRAGHDVGDRDNNKLEIHTVSDDSNGTNQNVTPQPNNGNGITEENATGESKKPSKIPSRNRSSADTVIVETCYETAADIQKDLESPTGDIENGEKKSLRDCITYSEPLTPMLQEVLDDFQSEPENELDAAETTEKIQAEVSRVKVENGKSSNDTNVDTEKTAESTSEKISGNAQPNQNKQQNKDEQTTIDKEISNNNKPEKVQDLALSHDNDNEIVCLDSPEEDNGELNKEEDKTNYANKLADPIDTEETAKTKGTDKNAETKDIDKIKNTDNTAKTKDTEKNTETNVADKNAEVKDTDKTAKIKDINKTDEIMDTDKSAEIPNNTLNTEIHDSSENIQLVPPSDTLPNSNCTDSSLPNNPEALKKRISDENSLPNNPEALKKRISDGNQNSKPTQPEKKQVNKVSRKRSNSENIVKPVANKKTKLQKNKKKAVSETEDVQLKVDTGKTKPKKVETMQDPVKEESIKEDIVTDSIDNACTSKVMPNLAQVLEKPSTSFADDVNQVLLTSDSDQGGKKNKSSENVNPCLQNMSLFEEQFNKQKYNMSESSDAEKKKQDANVEETKVPEKKIELPKSHTESNTEDHPSPSKKRHRAGVATSNKDKDRALANVFGFSGASQAKRRRQLSRRRRTISQNNVTHNNGGSNSSEWTSESDSDMYVLPPRGRKNRQTRKYLKPQSGRVFSLEEGGGLFVMYGKKIYPLVKDGKLVKNYLHYIPESDSEEEKNYWKSKYVEEKKKAEELKKLLEEAKEPHEGTSSLSLPANPLRNSTANQYQPQAGPSNRGQEVCVPAQEEKKEVVKTNPSESIKIKFTTKNDQEIHLEGNWPQIHNVLEHVVQIFHKEPQPVSEFKRQSVVEPPSSSGLSTPVVITAVHEPNVDPDVHEKVNKIESEIFKEIEERDKEEQHQPSTNGHLNVTKRKGRPRKSSLSSAAQSPVKRQKVSDHQDSEVNSTNNKISADNENNVANEGPKPRQNRTRRSTLNETPVSSDVKVMQTRRSKVKLDTSADGKGDEDEEVRYMFPPKNKRQSVKAATDKNTRDKSHKSPAKAPSIFSSPETVCPNSVESTLGYQDSDPTPMKTELRKKKFMNDFELKSRSISHLRRSSRINKPQLILYNDDSIQSNVENCIKTIERDNSSLNTEVYRSESYQLLMPKTKPQFSLLEQIDETSPLTNELNFIKHLGSTAKNEICPVQHYTTRNSDLISSDIGSSSNVSLPMSPELSIVENMSVSKEFLNNLESEPGPLINEMQCNETNIPVSCSQYFISNIDVSVPLMQQECGLESSNVPPQTNEEPMSIVSECLVSKIGTFNIDDQPNLTDTLDIKLRNLLLESAKKIAIDNKQSDDDKMDVDVPLKEKAKTKKRCSTPRKRKDSRKSKKLPKQPVIEEEHVETYSKGGRKSCPPIIQPTSREDHLIVEDINITALSIDENVKPNLPKGRKKKDVIKVKILKPKSKKSHNNTTKSERESIASICTDSGINDTASGVFQQINDSVDLIHNHSETCLHANECVGDSVEFVENSKSIVTLEDSNRSDDNIWDSQYEFNDAEDMAPDLFSNDAQDMKSFYNAKLNEIANTEDTVYHSPISSLMTEDLSDDLQQQPIQPNKWYLLSEDETVNTMNKITPSENVACYGANLKEIFLPCAVPDLSTITERSRENDDDSRKPTLEGISADDFNSQSTVDSNVR